MNFLSFIEPSVIIKTAGLAGIFAVIFAESGLLIGLFLPGDSLLFTAGVFASQGYLPISLFFIISFIAAVLGDSTGYALGKKFGPKIFTPPLNSALFEKSGVNAPGSCHEVTEDREFPCCGVNALRSRAGFTKRDGWIRAEYVERAKLFYQNHGGKTVILARFIPVVRTLAPTLAGVGMMRYRTFLFYNIIGAALWVFGLGGLGFYFGSIIPNIDAYLLPIVGIIIFFSILPALIETLRSRERRSKIRALFFSKKNS